MKYLTYPQRLQIEALYKAHIPIKKIADIVGCCFSTVYKELKRGRVQLLDTELREYTSYSADIAQQKLDYAQTSKGRPLKLGSDHAFADFITSRIKQDNYSPAAALAEANDRGFDTQICVNTLYSYIDKGVLAVSNRDLPVKGKRKKTAEPKRTGSHRVKEAPSIDLRPEYVNDRSELGHWEMDCVCSGVGKRAALLVFTERVSRYELIFKLPDKTTASVVGVLDKLERQLRHDFPKIFRSITVDNGSEFCDWHGMRRSLYGGLRTEIYYCHPYRSSERGSNENANRIIRRFIPKGTDISRISHRRVREIQDWMNHYPRRVLGYACAADFGVCPGL